MFLRRWPSAACPPSSACGSALRLASACFLPVPAAPAHAARLAACRVCHRHGYADAMIQKTLNGADSRAVSVKAVSAAVSWLNLLFGAAQGFRALSRGGGEATCRASRRGFRGISSVAALPAVFHDHETPPVTPACNPTETPREALRARTLQPQSEAAPKSRFNLTKRENHGSRNDHRHKHRRALPRTPEAHQKAGGKSNAQPHTRSLGLAVWDHSLWEPGRADFSNHQQ